MTKLDLSERAIMRLPIPAKGPRDYPDNHIHQLVPTIRPTGSRSWTLRYRFGEGEQRRQRRLTLGTWPDVPTEDARERALHARKLLARGIDPIAHEAEQRRLADEKRQVIAERSFAKLAERFVLSQRKRERRSWPAQARVLGFKVKRNDADARPELTITAGGLAARWLNRPVAEFERLDITLVVDELMDADRPEAARSRLNILKTFFAWCENAGYISRSPIEKYRLDLAKASRDRVLSDAELGLFWKATDAEHYPFQQFLRLLLLTGQRRNEVAGLQHSEINADVWELPAARSKNKHAHKVPLSPLAAAVIASAPRYMSGLVLTSTGKRPLSGFSALKRRIDKRMTELAGPGVKIPQWGLHDLRRTAASGMAALGVAPHVIESALNHRSGEIRGVAGTYNRFDYFDAKRDALERWAERVAKVVSAEPEIHSPSNVITLQTA